MGMWGRSGCDAGWRVAQLNRLTEQAARQTAQRRAGGKESLGGASVTAATTLPWKLFCLAMLRGQRTWTVANLISVYFTCWPSKDKSVCVYVWVRDVRKGQNRSGKKKCVMIIKIIHPELHLWALREFILLKLDFTALTLSMSCSLLNFFLSLEIWSCQNVVWKQKGPRHISVVILAKLPVTTQKPWCAVKKNKQKKIQEPLTLCTMCSSHTLYRRSWRLVANQRSHLAEDRFVGLGEELGQFLRVAQVQWQTVDAKTFGVQVLLLAQLVDVHPLHHQGAVALHKKVALVFTALYTWQLNEVLINVWKKCNNDWTLNITDLLMSVIWKIINTDNIDN